MSVLAVAAVVVLVVVLAVGVRALARRPRRVQAGYLVGVLVYLAVNLLLRGLPGDDRDWPYQLLVAALTVAVAVDVLRQVPRARPTRGRAAVAVAGWGLGAFFLTSIVVAVYVARRVMGLPVIPRARQPVSSARS